MRSDWLIPLCGGGGAPEGRRRQEGASDAEARGAAAPRDRSPRPSPAMSCSTPSSAPAPPARWRKRLGRRFIGIERDQDYAAVARARIAADRARPTAEASWRRKSKRDEPRIPFGTLVERGLAHARATCCSTQRRRWTAKVRADGTLISAEPAARSTRWARRCRARPPATAGPSGASSIKASWSRSTCCASACARRWRRARDPARLFAAKTRFCQREPVARVRTQ